MDPIPEIPNPFPASTSVYDQPATSLAEDFILAAATQAARQVTSGTIASLPGFFEQSSHSANKTRPPNKRDIFLANL